MMNSSDVKHKLHNEVFHPNGERLLGFTQVSKTEPSGMPFVKKDNVHYLCVSVTVKRPNQVFISRYRTNESGSLKRRRLWKLEELNKVDGKEASQSCNEFILTFDREFKFESSTQNDKESFLSDLGSACAKYSSSEKPFVNVNKNVLNAMTKAGSSMSAQLNKTKQALDDRGENLKNVEKATADMANSAENFSKAAHQLSERYKE